MTMRKRLIAAGILLAFATVLYGTARHYSPSLILYVVQQSLVQKAPQGIDAVYLERRLNDVLSAAPDQKTKMERLLRISQRLEKVQKLTPAELEIILAIE